MGMGMSDEDSLDFAIVVYREDAAGKRRCFPVALTSDLDGLIHALRQQPSMSGTIGLVAVGDEFFVALRVFGERVRSSSRTSPRPGTGRSRSRRWNTSTCRCPRGRRGSSDEARPRRGPVDLR